MGGATHTHTVAISAQVIKAQAPLLNPCCSCSCCCLVLTMSRPTQKDDRRLQEELEEREVEVGSLQAELIVVDVELMGERAARAAAEAEKGRLEGEVGRMEKDLEVLRGEKRRREDERDVWLSVVKGLQDGTELGRQRWLDWERKAKWGWFKEGKYGWRWHGEQGSSSGSSSSSSGNNSNKKG